MPITRNYSFSLEKKKKIGAIRFEKHNNSALLKKEKKMIDLRSDTVTTPTEGMREAIKNALVGDDVFMDDPTVNELQDFAADFFGKEAALFVPSGTMANQISIAINTKPGDEVIVESEAHIFYYEAGAPSILSSVQLRCIDSETGEMDIDEIKSKIRPNDVHFPPTSLICIENTHNRHGGTIIPLDYIKKLEEVVKENGIALHCDGARLWNAIAASGVDAKDYVQPFDTVSVCLSKGLGAPVGSLILGSKEKIALARRKRKIFGGGMRQAGIIAAAGLYAMANHFPLLKDDHRKAKEFSLKLNESGYFSIDLAKTQTNLVFIKLLRDLDAKKLEEECLKRGLQLIAIGPRDLRAVFHFQIDDAQSEKAYKIMIAAVEALM